MTNALWILGALSLVAAALCTSLGVVIWPYGGALALLAAACIVWGVIRHRATKSVQAYNPYDVLAADFTQQTRLATQAGHNPKALPCYIVVGARGAGKSSLMRAMGLRGGAQYLSNQQQSACQFWLDQAALFVDTPAQLNTGREGPAAWDAFVTLVKRRIGMRRIAGVLVVVDIKTMAPARLAPADVQHLSHQLSTLNAALAVQLPTYVMLSQADSITGFVQSFDALDENAKRQVLGATLPHDGPESPLTQLSAYLRELYETLQHHAALRLDYQTRLEERHPIFLFPQYMAELGPHVQAFLGQVFQASGFTQAPWLRGVYFCSAGAHDSAAASEPTGTLVAGLPARIAPLKAGSAAVQTGGIFIEDFVQRVLPSDRRRGVVMMGRGIWGAWQRSQRTLLLAAAAGLIASFEVFAFASNWSLAHRGLKAVETLRSCEVHPSGVAPELAPLTAVLEPLLAEVQAGPSLVKRLGLYQGDALVVPLAQSYIAYMHRQWVAQLVADDSRALQSMWRRFERNDAAPTAAEYHRAFVALKTHLLLTRPRGAREPVATPAAQAWLRETLVARYFEGHASPSDAEVEQKGRDVMLLATLLGQFEHLALPRDPELVSRTRAILRRIAQDEAQIDTLQQSAAELLPALSVRDIIRSAEGSIRGRNMVPGIFTRAGFEQVAEAWLKAQSTQQDAWVLSEVPPSPSEMRRLALEVRARYMTRYIESWQHFIDGLVISAPEGAHPTLVLLEALTRGEPGPLKRIFAAVADNTRLVRPDTQGALRQKVGGLFAGVTERLQGADAAHGLKRNSPRDAHLGPEAVAQSFASFASFGAPPEEVNAAGSPAPLALDAYQDNLIEVRNALQAYLDDPREADNLLGRVHAARNAVHALIAQRELAPGVKPRLEALLLTPLTGLSQGLVTDARAQKRAAFCGSVVKPFSQLAQAYPFSPHGRDASLNDVADFFKPGTGQLWGFVTGELSHDIVARGDGFVFDERMGGVIRKAYNPQVLHFLQQAQRVSRALFADNQTELSVAFEARLEPGSGFDDARLDIDGQSLIAQNGPSGWQRMLWPGPDRGTGATLLAKGLRSEAETLRHDGEWGLYRLLEEGHIQGDPNQGRLTVDFSLNADEEPVRLHIRLLRRNTPFFGQGASAQGAFLQTFRAKALRPPEDITQNGQRCAR